MYEDVIKLVKTNMETCLEGEIMQAVMRVGVEVNKEELIRALAYDRGQYEKGYRDGRPKWISVGDQLPSGFDYFDDGTAEPAEYIVKVKNAEVATIAMFDGNEWIPAQYNGITEDRWFAGPVTHWMPLPELPGEKT